MKVNLLNLITAGVFGIALTGCATSQNLPVPSSDTIPKDTARIKLERNSGFVGGARSPLIKDNGVKVGDLGNYGNGLLWDRPAGDTCLTDWGNWKLCFYAKGGKITNVQYGIMEGFSLQDFEATRKELNIIDINQ